MKLRRQNSLLNRSVEGQAKKRKVITLAKIFYYLVLSSIVLYVLYYAFNKLFYIDTYGHVMSKKYEIISPSSGIIKFDENLDLNSNISKNQLLATINHEKILNERIESNILENEQKLNDLESEILNENIGLESIENQLRNEFIKLTSISKNYQKNAQRYKNAELLQKYTSEVNKVLEEKKQIQLDLELIKKNISFLKSKINLKKQLIEKREAKLNQLKKIVKNNQNIFESELIVKNKVFSPSNGYIEKINLKNNSFVKENEKIAVISENKPVIVVFIKDDFLENIYINKKVNIKFPDENTLEGRIISINSSEEFFNATLQKDYDILRTKIIAVVQANTDRDLEFWKKYRGLRITASMRK